jgi:hypothetical protein
MLRGCIEAPCPNLTTRVRCTLHERQRVARRGTRQQQGYGVDHQQAREALRATLPGPCAYGCGRYLTPDGVWNAAHVVDGDPSYGYVASCVSCNQRAKRRRRAVPGGTPVA